MASNCNLLVLPCLVLLFHLFLRFNAFQIQEATIDEIHLAFKEKKLTSRKLVDFYFNQIEALNPLLRAVIEVNPDALSQADKADQKRWLNGGNSTGLQGIPVLVKDNFATKDRMETTAGSLALVGSIVPRDAAAVERLRLAGAVILGKASLSEWSSFRSYNVPSGWSARGGQGKNPYVLSADPCGSSSGSAIAVASNLAMVSIGTETGGSIICPSSSNGVVGIKPTVGLTSRAGVIPISPMLDTVGPISRTVTDAVYVLDEIVGFDSRDEKATREAQAFIPKGGYKQFLKRDGLKGKRLGIIRKPFFDFPTGSPVNDAMEKHFRTMRENGAILVDNLEPANLSTLINVVSDADVLRFTTADFKRSLNAYLSELLLSPVRSLADVIAFNSKNSAQEKVLEYGQEVFLLSEATNGIGPAEEVAARNFRQLSRDSFERLMLEKKLDAVVTLDGGSVYARGSAILVRGGNPGISVPAGYGRDGPGVPFGICFGGLRGSEPKLIEIAYAFEQATKVRRRPTLIQTLEQLIIKKIKTPYQMDIKKA